MHATTLESVEWGPVGEPQRAIGVDVLRGFALFGVLVANTLQFAYPVVSAPSELEVWRGTGAADRATVLLVGLLVEGKFYTLLSFLFGMGLALQAERARSAGRPFVGFSLRRSAFLFLIGVVHGVCLFAADILAFYAIVAAVAVAFRRWPARNLAAAAAASACLGVAILSIYAWSHPDRPFQRPLDWSKIAHQGERAELPVIERSAAAVLERLGVPREAFIASMADEVRISREGSWAELTRLRAIIALLLGLPAKVLLLGTMFLAFFLAGMWLVRSVAGSADTTAPSPAALLTRPDQAGLRRCRTWFLVGVPLGLVLVVVGSGVQLALPRSIVTPPIYWAFVFGGVFAQSLGYAGGMVRLAALRPNGRLVRWLAPVGRTALSNYVAQSVMLGFVFYGTGLGLFAHLNALPVVSLALPAFALEVWLSRAWLRRFSIGPVEWVWRSLSYGRRLPIRRSVS